MKNINKEIKETLNLFNFKKSTQDKSFLEKNKNFFSSPHNFFYINTLLLSENIQLKISKIQIFKGINFLIHNQSNNGSFDEWYANEDSFCATSYAGYLLSKVDKRHYLNQKNFKNSLKKIYFFLKSRSNFNNFNQELAKFAFYINYFDKVDTKYKKQILAKTLEYENYEYEGLDLGYLSVNLMIISDILLKRFDTFLYKIFKKQLNLYSQLSENFEKYPNYIFSRSSRLHLFSGFYYAYKKGLIKDYQIKKIYSQYVKVLNLFKKKKNLKYLSFFYLSDFVVISEINKINSIKSKKKVDKYVKKISNNYISLRIKNDVSISIYLKNANLFSVNNKNRCNYYFDYNLNLFNSKLVPKVNEKIIRRKNFIFMKNSFVKIGNIDKFSKYFKCLSILNKFFKAGNVIKILGRYLLIKSRMFNNLVLYKKIFVIDNKIKVREIIISRSKNLIKKNSLSLDNKQQYFSPTSFILKSEVGLKKKERKKLFFKMNKSVFIREYECFNY